LPDLIGRNVLVEYGGRDDLKHRSPPTDGLVFARSVFSLLPLGDDLLDVVTVAGIGSPFRPNSHIQVGSG
jgi:hypothetical protein